MEERVFADIILPVPILRLFTYSIPIELLDQVGVGVRVVVPFGRKKTYSGVIYKVHKDEPLEYETKDISAVLDRLPMVNDLQLKFWEWVADYYLCTLGEVYKAAVPSGLKLESETKVIYNAEFEADSPLSKREGLIYDFLASKKMASINEINNASGLKNCLPVLNKLLAKQAIFVNEHLKEGYKARVEKQIALAPVYRGEEKLRILFDGLGRAPKQLELLMHLVSLMGVYVPQNYDTSVDRKTLLDKCKGSSGTLNTLLKKGVLLQEEKEIGRLASGEMSTLACHDLNESQQLAFGSIKEQFDQKDVVLLHGVTSSGKTEIYLHLIEEQVRQGKQVLYLLPEIALTAQMTNRLRKVLGNKLGIYHSKFSDAERVEVWNDVLNTENYQVILGVRSSLFLPFTNLGLIIVDEEHENSFKQYDPAPRYNARDASMMLARFHNAKVLMGTATPSIETYYNVKIGKYGLVELFERFKGIEMPQIMTVDIKEARRKKQMKSHFSPQLLQHVEEALNSGKQAILFQNRRGFAPFLECNQCAWVPKCNQCDVSMTYHKNINQLICHYCGYSYQVPGTCGACQSPTLETQGFGTQKIEEEIQIFFPDAKVGRMDVDTTRSKKAYERIIASFESGEMNILIGTQMVSKGLDFENVSIVGILNADNMLNFPDFRAFERSFQLMAQVSGRAGRKNKRGTVILQTTNTNHPVVQDVLSNNFANHFIKELEERKQFKYPPFYRLISINVKCKDQLRVNKGAFHFGQMLRAIFGERVLGPQAPPISRIQNLYIRKILLKFERNSNLPKAKGLIREAITRLNSQEEFKSVIVQVDVDPM